MFGGHGPELGAIRRDAIPPFEDKIQPPLANFRGAFLFPSRHSLICMRLSLVAPACPRLLPLVLAIEFCFWFSGPLRAQSYRAIPLKIPEPGRAGFSELSASGTGIVFSNRLRNGLIMDNNNFMQGSGVAAGDFDKDGLCDLYFCAIDGTNALYRNRGNWRFEDVTESAGVGCANWHSTGTVFADVDGDGNLDLLVATLGNGVHLFINDGHGHFRETTDAAGLRTQTGSTSMALADVDGDGDLDLYVANYGAMAILRSGGGGSAQMKQVDGKWVITGPYAQRLQFVEGRLEEVGEPDVLYLNDGRGHFKAVPWNSNSFLDEQGKPKPEPWDFGLSVQMRDLNGDGAPEIYVCNDFQTVDRFWMNDGHGHFRAIPRLAIRHQSFASMGVDFADLDRDGFFDFLTVEMMSREHSRRMRQVSALQPSLSPIGRLDNRPEIPRNTFFRNRGDGTFAEIAPFSGIAATEWSWQPVFIDVDLDGFEDLLIVNGHAFDVQDRDVLAAIRSMKQLPGQARTNILMYPSLTPPNIAFRNRHDLTFEDTSAAWNFNSTRISHGIALADFDNDGALDIAINCLDAPPLLYRNESSAPRICIRLEGTAPNTRGIGGLIKVFGGPVPMQMQEIIAGGRYLSSDDPMRTFAAKGGPLRIEVSWRSGKNTTIDGAQPNHLYVISEPAESAAKASDKIAAPAAFFADATHLLDFTHDEEFYLDYAKQPLLMKQLSQFGPGVAWVDLDGDGIDELLIGNGKNASPAVFKTNGTNTFRKLSPPWSAPDDMAGMAAWFSADGKATVLSAVANYESVPSNTLRLVECSLTGVSPLSSVSLTRNSSPGPIAVADIDGDGDLDLFVGGRLIPGAYPAAADSAVYRNSNGTLVLDSENSATLKGVGMVSAALWSDLDQDGFPELILACEWSPIRIFHNDRGRLKETTRQFGFEQFTGWWNGVAVGDFDEDGRLDIIASNWGLNTGYETSSEHPLEIFYGDFAGHGVTDIVEAYYAPELHAMVPRRTLNSLSQAFPALSVRFATHKAFSTATIEDVLKTIGGKPRRVQANTLATMLFLNRGSNFIAVPLPAEAQWAPAFGVCVADFDGDGHEDVFLSQNFFPMRPEWPRQDSGRGLWLRGDGQGHLVPVPGQESGVTVYGDQRGAAVGDFNQDGRVDLVVAQNGAAARLFQNVRAKPGVRVRLKGRAANPNVIGAIVRPEYSNGRMGPAQEIHGGSGYWSQDSLTLIIAPVENVTRLHVLWPGGAKSVTSIDKSTGLISVTEP